MSEEVLCPYPYTGPTCSMTYAEFFGRKYLIVVIIMATLTFATLLFTSYQTALVTKILAAKWKVARRRGIGCCGFIYGILTGRVGSGSSDNGNNGGGGNEKGGKTERVIYIVTYMSFFNNVLMVVRLVDLFAYDDRLPVGAEGFFSGLQTSSCIQTLVTVGYSFFTLVLSGIQRERLQGRVRLLRNCSHVMLWIILPSMSLLAVEGNYWQAQVVRYFGLATLEMAWLFGACYFAHILVTYLRASTKSAERQLKTSGSSSTLGIAHSSTSMEMNSLHKEHSKDDTALTKKGKAGNPHVILDTVTSEMSTHYTTNGNSVSSEVSKNSSEEDGVQNTQHQISVEVSNISNSNNATNSNSIVNDSSNQDLTSGIDGNIQNDSPPSQKESAVEGFVKPVDSDTLTSSVSFGSAYSGQQESSTSTRASISLQPISANSIPPQPSLTTATTTTAAVAPQKQAVPSLKKSLAFSTEAVVYMPRYQIEIRKIFSRRIAKLTISTCVIMCLVLIYQLYTCFQIFKEQYDRFAIRQQSISLLIGDTILLFVQWFFGFFPLLFYRKVESQQRRAPSVSNSTTIATEVNSLQDVADAAAAQN